MIKVRKRNGFIHDFDLRKTRLSILNCANEINYSLDEADIKLLLNEVLYMISNVHTNNSSNTISTYELKGMVYCALVNEGFGEVAAKYTNISFRKYS